MSKARFEKLVREGRIEALTDLNLFNRIEIRWRNNGKRETVILNKLGRSK